MFKMSVTANDIGINIQDSVTERQIVHLPARQVAHPPTRQTAHPPTRQNSHPPTRQSAHPQTRHTVHPPNIAPCLPPPVPPSAQYSTPFHVGPGPPPTYEECQDLNVPPPSYESLFGRVKEVEKNSNGFLDFLKNLFILVLGTAGCTLMISVTVIIPVFMIIIGSLKMHECPAERFVPIYLVVGGSFGVLKNLVSFNRRYHRTLNEEEEAFLPWHKRLNFTSLLNYFLTGWFITGCVWVFRIYEPNYTDVTSKRYCDYTLYMFAFWLVTSVYVSVGLLTSCVCCLSIVTVILQKYHLIANQA